VFEKICSVLVVGFVFWALWISVGLLEKIFCEVKIQGKDTIVLPPRQPFIECFWSRFSKTMIFA
jgi:hypothetical protein